MSPLSRRAFLLASAAPLAWAAKPRIPLCFGTYGMKSLLTDEALKTLSAIGYDGVELCLLPGWPCDPAALPPSARREIRSLLDSTGLVLPAVLEGLPLAGTPEKRTYNLERLKLAAALAHGLSPLCPPVLDTVLGGKAADWLLVRDRFADELDAWARLAATLDFTVCCKPHADQALNSPQRALWLLRQVNSPRLRLIYDYSHMLVEGYSLESSLTALLPHIAFISVKDARGNSAHHEYLLPGDGATDYAAYFRLLDKLGYGGGVGVEVSSMIHQRPGYQPVETARLCYRRLEQAMAQAGLRGIPR
ncbi:sugar phosphate isomerase/epimerase family protein [uncultured Paludibaculum sp.]|uniref:sugar phosphate isomerase/epimerase family protein n=1 Tax=uncultured Paludibaculum sp. TaxID=1765020 RepID=UPI002AAAC08D|nr:sugar phosphate isomerase/epimerase family protein [uncultured Paludibaculum sp.]